MYNSIMDAAHAPASEIAEGTGMNVFNPTAFVQGNGPGIGQNFMNNLENGNLQGAVKGAVAQGIRKGVGALI